MSKSSRKKEYKHDTAAESAFRGQLPAGNYDSCQSLWGSCIVLEEVSTDTLRIIDLAKKSEAKQGEATVSAEFTIDNVEAYCVSRDRQFLAVVNFTEIRIFTAKGLQTPKVLTKPFHDETSFIRVSFIGDNSHVGVLCRHTRGLKYFTVLDVNTGLECSLPFRRLKMKDFCQYDKNRIIAAEEGYGLRVHDICFKPNISLASSTTILIPYVAGAIHYGCAVSLDGCYLAAKYELILKNFVACFAIQPDLGIVKLGDFPAEQMRQGPLFFTSDNSLVFSGRNKKLCRVEMLSPELSLDVFGVYKEPEGSCDLLNGDVFEMSSTNGYTRHPCQNRKLYQNAFEQFFEQYYAKEVYLPLNKFSKQVAGIVSGYSYEAGLFSKLKAHSVVDGESEREFLKNCLLELVSNPVLKIQDRNAIENFLKPAEKGIGDCVNEALAAQGVSAGFKDFFEKVKYVFKPADEKKAAPW